MNFFRFAQGTGNAVSFIILKSNATMALFVISGVFPVIHVRINLSFPRLILSYDFFLTQQEPFVVIAQFMLLVACNMLRLYVSTWPADDIRDMVS